MKFLVFFGFLLASALSLRVLGSDNLQQHEKGADIYSRITHGFTALPGQFPYQVGLKKLRGNSESTAGGVLISREWVLSAVHCIIGTDTIHVYLGQLKLQRIYTTIHRPSRNVIEHSGYEAATMLNDISLIRIPPVRISNVISPINLPNSPPMSYYHVRGVLAGWGKISDSTRGPSLTLQYAMFTVISNADCAASFGAAVMREGKLCTAAPSPTSGCHGDSGGALALTGSNILVVILSLGDDHGCELGTPMAFTRVDHYLGWIREKINS